MAPAQMPNSGKWHKPPTAVYEDNYGFGINYYQPMIDYITAKERGASVRPPHLPYNNELGLEKYRHDLPVRTYSQEDLRKISSEVSEHAKRSLEDYQLAKRSAFSVIATAAAANITKHVGPENPEIVQAKKKRLERTEKRLAASLKREMDAIERDINEYEAQAGAAESLKKMASSLKGKSAKAIAQTLLQQTYKNVQESHERPSVQNAPQSLSYEDVLAGKVALRTKIVTSVQTAAQDVDCETFLQPLAALRHDLISFQSKNSNYLQNKSKQTSIEIEQLNARVVEAETRLKTEVTRIKKKLQVHITELELSLDVANKTNLDLQKTIKKQSLQLTEIQAHYDEVQRQLQVTLDQLGVTQRRVQALTGEVEEVRGNYEQALRSKRAVEQQYEEATIRINELTVINVNLSSSKAKVEQELAAVAADYDEITKELRIADERYQRVQVELKHTVEHLHEEQERIVKIDAVKKSLEIEVKNLSVRLEEVETNAIVGGKRIISKLEARIKDIELELDEEKRRHAETIKILRKKERTVKEVMIQCEEDQKNIQLLQDSLEKQSQKVNIYKRQLHEQEGMSQQSVTRVRRFQRELEAAEDRADTAESNLSLIRAKHRTFVTTSTVPGSQVYLVQESRALSSE